jgi:ankyrin repeat protein
MTLLLGKEGKVYGMVANNTTSRNKNGGTSKVFSFGLALDTETDVVLVSCRADTPLHYAAMHGRPEVVQWLLDHHAAVNNQNTCALTSPAPR